MENKKQETPEDELNKSEAVSVDHTDLESNDAREVDTEATDAKPNPEARIVELEAALADLKDRSLRALADAENTRRRAEREVADAKKYGPSGLVKDLLNVSDNLHRALESVGEELKDSDETIKNLVVGVEMVAKEFLSAFEKHGVTKLSPLGDKFDHAFHQAMFEVEDAAQPAGTIVQLLQPGYVLHDRLLRPAMVAVSKGGGDKPPDDVEHLDTTA
ncbi:MAG: nucleotide exchange factor GrpE [Rhodospirillaceae bacterium]|nr:nucleotide exchange factor GrpE [Rhodospirillaceae bacterium]